MGTFSGKVPVATYPHIGLVSFAENGRFVRQSTPHLYGSNIERSFFLEQATGVLCNIKGAHTHFVWCLDQALRWTRERSRSK